MEPQDEKPPQAPSLRSIAEAQLARDPLAHKTRGLPAEELLHELQVHQIELEMRNAALRAAQLELEASRNRYVDLYDFAPSGCLSLTLDGLIQEANLTAAEWLGVARGQLLNRDFVSCVAPRDQDRWTLFLRRMMPPGDKHTINLAMRRADGTVFPARLVAAPREVGVTEGNPFFGTGDTVLRIALTDISEHRTEQDRQFRMLVKNLDGMAYRCRNDPSWSMEFVSEGSLALLGVSPQELTSGTCNYADFMHPQDREPVWREAQANLAARRRCRHEYRIITRDGGEKWVLELASGMYADDGTLEAIEGFVTDITARKQLELAQQASAAAQQAILQAIPDLLFELDEDGRYHKIHARQPELLAAEEARLLGRTLGEMLPAAAAAEGMAALREAARDGCSYGRQICLPLPQGESWFELSVAALPLVAGTPRHFIVLSHDITARKSALAGQLASEARLREAQVLAQMGSWELDLARNLLSWSAEIFHIFEIDPARFDANYEQFIAAVYPDDRAAVDAAYQASVANKAPYSIEHRLLLPDGRVKWVAELGRTDYDASGKPLRSLGTVQDISARMAARDALRESQQRLVFHLEHTPIAAIEWNLDFTVAAWNPAATEIFGYSREEALGRKGSFLLPPGEREPIDRTWEPLQAGSGGRRSINENVRRDGTVIICEWFNTTLRDSEGRVVGAASLAQDITARRRLQDALEHALARTRLLSERLVAIQEEERSMIAHELHDEVGQNLTAAKIHLQAMEPMARDHATFPHENLREALAAVAHTLEQVRSLSLDLRPLQLDDLGLVVSLGALLERDAAAAGWVAHFDPDVRPERIEPDLALACYRVAQESLTNIMRHAAASAVHVRLILDTEELELAIRDDGRGFDVAAVEGNGGVTSLGLFSMEERVRSRGGTFEILSATGRGTEVVARFPLRRPAAGERQ
ncbi:MAG: PAS domain S-box protein [Rhodocyclaceae bacterium]|nr:PAS domain S-box protein [Rhodocyclaceae bacterium]MDP3033389.1 PAS domain S-box protein [Rhodocyclaceae bacterium]